jgi:hypothetical protein
MSIVEFGALVTLARCGDVDALAMIMFIALNNQSFYRWRAADVLSEFNVRIAA